MSEYSMFELSGLFGAEDSLFPPLPDGVVDPEPFSSKNLFEDMSSPQQQQQHPDFAFLDLSSPAGLSAGLQQTAADLLSPALTSLLSPNITPHSSFSKSPSVSPSVTLRNSPEVAAVSQDSASAADMLAALFPGFEFDPNFVDPNVLALYSSMVAGTQKLPESAPDLEKLLKGMLPDEQQQQQQQYLSQSRTDENSTGVAASLFPPAVVTNDSAASPMPPSMFADTNAVVMPLTDEMPNMDAAGLRKVLETYVKRQQEAAEARLQKEQDANKPRKSKVGRKPKPRATDPLGILQETMEKRAKNTAAARRSRQRRAEKVDDLEARVTKLVSANAQNLLRGRQLDDKTSALERELAYAQDVLRLNGLECHVRCLPSFEVVEEVDVSDCESS